MEVRNEKRFVKMISTWFIHHHLLLIAVVKQITFFTARVKFSNTVEM